MPLASGARIGPYEIIGAIGAGGMGEVYRARDTKLHREVAFKILPDAFAADPDRMARFEREAQVLASLNHPNIAQIYGLEGSGQAGSVRALAMELVEGEDLSKRLARGAIPLDEALPIAKQIALALEAAHALGIVHRDLKPANIKVTADGLVKVLDFGLAKAIEGESSRGSGDTSSPLAATMTSPAMTAMGMILGTAAYMAPEQARGRVVDKRADIWAFGCVLFEMLTASRLFAGEDMTETLAAVVKEQPDLSPAPREVRRLIAKCLEKDPKRRLRDIGDAWDLLDDPRLAEPAPAVVRRPSMLPWLLAAAAVVAAGAVSTVHFGETAPSLATTRFEVAWPDSESTGPFAISPDGRQMAIVSGGGLWVRPLDRVDAVRLEGADGATYPFWSPGSDWIGFFAGGQLKKIAPAGGNPQVICEAADGRGASWSSNGTIVFSGAAGSRGLFRVPDAGGSATPVTTVSTSGSNDAHRYPQFLPDGEHFLFLHLAATPGAGGVYVGALDGTAPVRVREEQDAALYTTSPGNPGDGYLLFRRQGTLMAQAFDPAERQTSGAMFPVAENVGQGPNTGVGAFSVSAAGTLAHGTGISVRRRMVWLDRSGKQTGIASEDLPINSFALSRDERRLALGVTQSVALDTDIWVRSLPAGSASKLTFGPAPGWFLPLWSPDSSEVVYTTMDLAGLSNYEIRRKRSDMTGKEETLLRATGYVRAWDWSADGKWLVYGDGTDDLWFLPMVGEHTPIQVTKTPEGETYGQFSGDGRWLAYASGDRASPQVFVQPVPSTGAKWLVSAGVGSQPRWRRDGKELYYRRGDGQLMAVPIAGASAALEHGAPQPLFGSIPSFGNVERFTYQPSADGQRFLVVGTGDAAVPPITVVLNWQGAKR